MKNRITTTITTKMLMLFSYGINVGGLSGGLSFWYNHFPLLMSENVTFHPRLENRRTAAAPIPEAPPVIKMC